MDATRKRRARDKVRQTYYAYWRTERFARFIHNGCLGFKEPKLTRGVRDAANNS